MTALFSALIMVLGGGNGTDGMNEILDGIEPKAYFAARQIDYRVGALLEIIAEPRTKKLNDEKPQEVRKLLAARALGDLGDEAALPRLQEMAQSKKRFYAEYAKAAIAKIEGEEYTRPSVDAKAMEGDLALLPAGAALVFQARLSAGAPVDLKKAGERLEAATTIGENASAMIATLTHKLGRYAEIIGNVRLEGVTLALAAVD